MVKKPSKKTKFSDAKKRAGQYKKRLQTYLKRSPHRSFRLTNKYDHPVAPVIPGYIAFTNYVYRTLWREKKLFGSLLVLLLIIAISLVGLIQQNQYSTVSEALREYNELLADDGLDAMSQTGLLLSSVATGDLNATLTETQQLLLSVTYILVSLVTIWLLRHVMAGTKVRLRDGLYNAGAPFVAILALFSIAVLQLLPLALGAISFSAATGGEGLLGGGGIEAAVFALIAVLLGVLSLYWVSGTLFAIIIATIPGTYPMQALRSAGDIVVGQRMRLVLRIVWLLALMILIWAAILIPGILLDSWIAQSWAPFTVLAVQFLTGFSVIFGTSYIYLLYRKMIDEPAK